MPAAAVYATLPAVLGENHTDGLCITIVRYCPMVGTYSQLSCVMHKHMSLILQVAGFNAHDLIEMASIKTSDYVTVGGSRC